MSTLVHRPRKANYPLIARVVLASAWALVMGVGGVWAAVEWPGRLDPSYKTFCIVGGLTSLAIGEFVFVALVADRLFPRASPWLSWSVEALAALAFLAGFATLIAGAVWKP